MVLQHDDVPIQTTHVMHVSLVIDDLQLQSTQVGRQYWDTSVLVVLLEYRISVSMEKILFCLLVVVPGNCNHSLIEIIV
jgi:hypothetical protein